MPFSALEFSIGEEEQKHIKLVYFTTFKMSFDGMKIYVLSV